MTKAKASSILKDIDPEFSHYLTKHDEGLLNFVNQELDGEDINLEVESDDDDDLHEDIAKAPEITLNRIHSICQKASKGSLIYIRKLISLFRQSNQLESPSTEDDPHQSTNSHIPPELLEVIITQSLDNLWLGFRALLSIEKDSPIILTNSSSMWKSLKPTLLQFLRTLLSLIEAPVSIHNENQENCLIYLTYMENYVDFLIHFPGLLRQYIKILLSHWSSTFNEGDDLQLEFNQVVEARLKQLVEVMISNQSPPVEDLFKALYLNFIVVSKSQLSNHNLNRLLDSFKVLYSLDLATAYQQAFLYIRQLTLHLRLAVLQKGEKSIRTVKSKEYLQCIKLWCGVVIHLSKVEKNFNMLAFPLIQLLIGVYRYVTSAYYLPLRFALIQCLQDLSCAFKLFVPTNTLMLEVLEQTEKLLQKKTWDKRFQPVISDSDVILPKDSLYCRSVIHWIVEQLMFLIRAELEIYRFSPVRPEYFFLITRKMRLLAKDLDDGKLRKMIKILANQIRAATEETNRSITGFDVGFRSDNVIDTHDRLQKLRNLKLQGLIHSVEVGESTVPASASSSSPVKRKTSKPKKKNNPSSQEETISAIDLEEMINEK